MLFMVIETLRNQDAKAVYRRFRDRGRLMPEGMRFVDSWTAADLSRVFLLAEAAEVAPLQQWIAEWSHLIRFEVIPVIAGKETAAALAARLDRE